MNARSRYSVLDLVKGITLLSMIEMCIRDSQRCNRRFHIGTLPYAVPPYFFI